MAQAHSRTHSEQNIPSRGKQKTFSKADRGRACFSGTHYETPDDRGSKPHDMLRNLLVAVCTVVGLTLACHAVLDWVAYQNFLMALWIQ